jgi:hypothetical protein
VSWRICVGHMDMKEKTRMIVSRSRLDGTV